MTLTILLTTSTRTFLRTVSKKKMKISTMGMVFLSTIMKMKGYRSSRTTWTHLSSLNVWLTICNIWKCILCPWQLPQATMKIRMQNWTKNPLYPCLNQINLTDNLEADSALNDFDNDMCINFFMDNKRSSKNVWDLCIVIMYIFMFVCGYKNKKYNNSKY